MHTCNTDSARGIRLSSVVSMNIAKCKRQVNTSKMETLHNVFFDQPYLSSYQPHIHNINVNAKSAGTIFAVIMAPEKIIPTLFGTQNRALPLTLSGAKYYWNLYRPV